MTHEQSIVANGTKFRILIDGSPERPWLTCLHSLATRSELWDDQLGVLTEHFQVLRIDARGHGGSPPSAKPFGIEDLASDVVAIWDLIGVRESAVLGLSLGGMTALGLALDHGPRVTRMVAADCRADAPDFFRTMWTDRQRILTEQGMDAIADLTLPTWLTEKTRGTRPDLVSRVRRMIIETSHEGYRAATAALRGLNYKHRLTAIECPTCSWWAPPMASIRLRCGRWRSLFRGQGLLKFRRRRISQTWKIRRLSTRLSALS